MNKARADKLLSIALGLLGLFFVGAAMAVWFTGSHHWRVLGIKITLSEWHKPFGIGMSLLILRGLVADGPAWIVARAAALARWLAGRAGLDLERGAFLWLAFGTFLGVTGSALFARHYYYFFSSVGTGLVVGLGAGALCGWAHFIFYDMTEALLPRIFRVSSEARRSSIRLSLYLVFWAWLISGPLEGWEARLTEPIVSQSLVAALMGISAVWIFCPPWSPRGRAGQARRIAMIVAVPAILAYVFWCSRVERGRDHPASPVRDRVFLITIDTVRADHLSCYGYYRNTSASLDALAKTGSRFSRAFTEIDITDPSHVSMFTGLYPRTHGIENPFNARAAGNVLSMIEYFRDRGFATAAISSRIALDPDQLGVPGFSYISLPWSYNTDAPETYRRAMNWLRRHRDRNTFMWIHFFDPHQPYEPHPDSAAKFTDKKLKAMSADKWLDPGKYYSAEEVKDMVDLYDGEIAYTDLWLGRLLTAIRKLEPASERPPLIVVLADHGEILGELQYRPAHYAFGHGGQLYNGVTHIPLIISWPGVAPAGEVVDDVVETVDLAPTLIEYIFGTHDYPGQGKSLTDVIAGRAHTGQRARIQRRRFDEPPRLYLAKKQFALVHWPYKLFYTVNGDVETYDLSTDFGEERDLTAARPDLVKDLFAELSQWLKDTPEAKGGNRTLSPAEIDRLRSLGYLP
ncbi:MAG TPA: sulfatase [bacterium]|nr:sulfatase [bacterium]